MPKDDVLWFDCFHHPADNAPGSQAAHHWCDFTREYLIAGDDAEALYPGVRICVPVVPTLNLYAQISLDTELIAGMMVKLALVKVLDAFAMNEELVDLGLHTMGEGRLVMASTLAAWMEGYEPNRCGHYNHSYKQEVELNLPANKTELYVKANRFTLTVHSKCYPCYLTQFQSATPHSPTEFNAADFGLDDTVSAPRPVRNQNGTRDALRNRYGQPQTREVRAYRP